MTSTLAVILLNMGGPENEAEIRPFLRNLFADKEIIQLPLRPLLSRLIIFFRTPKVIRNYRLIGGGSPLVRITRAQAWALEKELNSQGLDARVHVAMRYTPPRAEQAIDAAQEGAPQTVELLAELLGPFQGCQRGDIVVAAEIRPAVSGTGDVTQCRRCQGSGQQAAQ